MHQFSSSDRYRKRDSHDVAEDLEPHLHRVAVSVEDRLPMKWVGEWREVHPMGPEGGERCP